MTDLLAELAQKARALSPEDRARLAEELLVSLGADEDSAVDAVWDEAICKRITEIETGAVPLESADEVFSRLRQNLR